MADKKIGKVIHYYDKLGVAIINLKANLKIGQTIKISHGDSNFTQPVESMQIDHKALQEALKGQEIGLKVNQEVARGAEVYLVS